MPPAVVPADLHFAPLAGPTDGIDQFSDRFPIAAPDSFDSGAYTDLYDLVHFSGSSGVSYGGGLCVFDAGVIGEAGLKSKSAASAPYCWAEATIDSWTDGTAATVGFMSNFNTFLRWDVHFTGTPYPNKVGLHGKFNGGGVPGQTFAPTNPISLAAVLPFKIRCVMCWPEWWGWLEDANGNRAVMRGGMSSPDLRLLVNFAATWRPFFGALRFNTGASLTASHFRCGYTGGIRVRDFKPVTLADGRPYVDAARPTKRYVSTTCATGHDFRTNHLSVMSVDVDTGAAQIETLLHFNVASTDRSNPLAVKDMRTSLYGGQIVRSPADDKWILVVNGWGIGNASSGVGLWYAETVTDLTNDAGVLDLNAHLMTVYSFVPQQLSFYDNSFRWDGSKWLMCLTKTATPQNWTHYFPAIYAGPDLFNLAQVAQDQTYKAEGTCWSRVGGEWWVTSGGVGGPHHWDDNLAYQGNLLANLNLTGLNVSFNAYGSHFFMLPVDRESGTTTQYFCLLFTHDQLLASNATKGKLVVMDSDEIVDGTEF